MYRMGREPLDWRGKINGEDAVKVGDVFGNRATGVHGGGVRFYGGFCWDLKVNLGNRKVKM